jgi:glycerophosphoryl diester phosphodiesterase
MKRSNVEVQAHGGNSPTALRALLAAAPSSVEVDVGVTCDGALVLSHEVRATLHECPHSPLVGSLWRELTEAQARTLGRITLAEAMAIAGETRVVVEAKCFPPETIGPREFVDGLEAYLPSIALCSFDHRVLSHARRRHRELETTFLFEVPAEVSPPAQTLGPRADLVTRRLVEATHAMGVRVVPWTVNDPDEMDALIELGVDGIVTDEPALLHDVLRRAASQSRRRA